MKVDLNSSVLDLEGKEIKDADGKTSITIGKICMLAFRGVSEQELSVEEKYKRYLLQSKLIDPKTVDLEVEEISEIKKVVGEFYPSNIMGPVFDFFEGKKK